MADGPWSQYQAKPAGGDGPWSQYEKGGAPAPQQESPADTPGWLRAVHMAIAAVAPGMTSNYGDVAKDAAGVASDVVKGAGNFAQQALGTAQQIAGQAAGDPDPNQVGKIGVQLGLMGPGSVAGGVAKGAATAAAAEPKPVSPWGEIPPGGPKPSVVPQGVGQPSEALAAQRAAAAAEKARIDATLTKAVGTTAQRAVSGYNLSAAPRGARPPAPPAAETGPPPIIQAPPLPPGAGGAPAAMPSNVVPLRAPGAVRAPSTVSPTDLKAFLTENGVPADQVDELVRAHTAFTGQTEPQAFMPTGGPLPKPKGFEPTVEPPPRAPAPLQAKAQPPRTGGGKGSRPAITPNVKGLTPEETYKAASVFGIAPETKGASDQFGRLVSVVAKGDRLPPALLQQARTWVERHPDVAKAAARAVLGHSVKGIVLKMVGRAFGLPF